MSDDGAEWTEAPRKGGLVTTFAVLNLVFGFLCGCLGAIASVGLFMLPGMFDMTMQAAGAQLQARRAAVATQVAQAEERLAATSDDPAASPSRAEVQAEVDGLQAQLVRLDQQDPTKVLQATRDLVHGPLVTGSIVGFASIAAIWNLGLVITGFGLFGRARWARAMVLGLSAFKLLLEAGFVAWVALSVGRAFDDVIQAVPPQALTSAGGQSVAQLRQAMQINLVGQTVFYAVCGSVYPAVLLIVFMLRSVRAEFDDWAQFRAGSGRG